ncbi:Bax inhibitor-1/YccA family protein [Haliovirga abyssi]|uniref:Membrane protein n=1 Tax=Haliovirga abyssi TaxID=2996794 RepID=A0AAU9D3G4_9FUSO|nr:Bax inhibitor-1/YccA family protein [Haliovirga abyssi]BDU50524.1 membrane protein [Haliovirga abyssi]
MFKVNQNYSYMDETVVSKLVSRIFSWMFMALLVTAGTAYAVMTSPSLTSIVMSSYIVIIVLEFAVVMGLSFLINKVSATTAKGLFFLYAVLNGFTFSIFVMFFTPASVIFSLALTTIIFGVMAAYGYFTKEDLTKFGPMLYAGIIILIITSVVNIFLHLSMLYWIISYMGVIIFTALIGFDVNRIKYMVIEMANGDEQALEKASIFGALQLYLDFINLFIYILRIFGNSRD